MGIEPSPSLIWEVPLGGKISFSSRHQGIFMFLLIYIYILNFCYSPIPLYFNVIPFISSTSPPFYFNVIPFYFQALPSPLYLNVITFIFKLPPPLLFIALLYTRAHTLLSSHLKEKDFLSISFKWILNLK